MILAAGRGERMRPLTDHTPKPLLVVGGKPLIVWHIERLVHAGFHDLIINHAHLGQQIEAALGDGARYGARIRYSPENEALETAGGIANALPLLGNEPFLAVNGDIYCDYDFVQLVPVLRETLQTDHSAYLVLVDNPAHHPQGDFCLSSHRVEFAPGNASNLTFSGIGVYRPELFRQIAPGSKAKLGLLLREQTKLGRVYGEHYRGRWVDVGTPQRLEELDHDLLQARRG